MAWDFSTEPEFEAKLRWMREFVREEIMPLELLDLSYDELKLVIKAVTRHKLTVDPHKGVAQVIFDI